MAGMDSAWICGFGGTGFEMVGHIRRFLARPTPRHIIPKVPGGHSEA